MNQSCPSFARNGDAQRNNVQCPTTEGGIIVNNTAATRGGREGNGKPSECISNNSTVTAMTVYCTISIRESVRQPSLFSIHERFTCRGQKRNWPEINPNDLFLTCIPWLKCNESRCLSKVIRFNFLSLAVTVWVVNNTKTNFQCYPHFHSWIMY